MLVQDLEGVQVAYVALGAAEPALFAAAKAEGKEFPFANHQPTHQVDLDAIPFRARIAALVTMELLAKGSP